MSYFNVLGTTLIIIGGAMMAAKWFFGFEQIGAWTLIPLFAGVFFNWLAGRKKGQLYG